LKVERDVIDEREVDNLLGFDLFGEKVFQSQFQRVYVKRLFNDTLDHGEFFCFADVIAVDAAGKHENMHVLRQ
jgi:hypothetical protein